VRRYGRELRGAEVKLRGAAKEQIQRKFRNDFSHRRTEPVQRSKIITGGNQNTSKQ